MTSPIKGLTKRELKEVEKALYSESLIDFVKAFWGVVVPAPYIDNWHIHAICDHLEAVARHDIRRLLINVPPRTAKSTITSVLFPAWVWTFDPSHQFLSASHSLSFAERDTRYMRDVVKSARYQSLWPLEFNSDQDSKTEFENTARGKRLARAFTSMTGSGCNTLIIDDPHSVDSAKSSTERQRTVDTFLEAAISRLNDPKKDAIIVIMQRLHEIDVSGVILDRKELGYEHLCLPMEWEGDTRKTVLGWRDPRTKLGELLFPERFGQEETDAYKVSLGPYQYAQQYQQTPVPSTDGFFRNDDFHRFSRDERGARCPRCSTDEKEVRHTLPKRLNYYMTSDHASGGTTKNDYNVVRIWGVDEYKSIWLVDSFRKQCTANDALGVDFDGKKVTVKGAGIIPFIRKYRPMAWFPEKDHGYLGIKDNATNYMRITDSPCRVHELTVQGQGDKATRAIAYQGMSQIGQVYLPQGPVGDTTLIEYVSFPGGKHDDQVDADAIMGRVMSQAHPAFILPQQEEEEELDYDWQDSKRRMQHDIESFF